MSLFTDFKKTKKTELLKKLNKSNIHQVPVIDKVTVCMGIGSLATRKGVKDFSSLQSNLSTIAGQTPHMILSRKAVSNFKLREGMPSMLRVTLRGEKAYDFIQRMVVLTLPRVRDFDGLNHRKFDGNGNYSLGFKDQSVFAELSPEDIKMPMGVQVSIGTTADTNEEAKTLLESLGLIFKKKEA